jgi:hypothetical protein
MSCIFTSYKEQKVKDKPKPNFDGEMTLEQKTQVAPLKNYICQEREHFIPTRCNTRWFKCSIADDCPAYSQYLIEYQKEVNRNVSSKNEL